MINKSATEIHTKMRQAMSRTTPHPQPSPDLPTITLSPFLFCFSLVLVTQLPIAFLTLVTTTVSAEEIPTVVDTLTSHK